MVMHEQFYARTERTELGQANGRRSKKRVRAEESQDSVKRHKGSRPRLSSWSLNVSHCFIRLRANATTH